MSVDSEKKTPIQGDYNIQFHPYQHRKNIRFTTLLSNGKWTSPVRMTPGELTRRIKYCNEAKAVYRYIVPGEMVFTNENYIKTLGTELATKT